MSNLQWFDPPSDWESVRLQRLVALRGEKGEGYSSDPDYIGLDRIESGTGKLIEVDVSSPAEPSAKTSSTTVSQFEKGDVLFGKLRPYLAKVWRATQGGAGTTELLALTPCERLDGQFLTYVLLTSAFIDLINSSTYGAKMPRADWGFMRAIPIPLPPLGEQRAIAAYLDRETARIDALIAAKRELVARLDEKRHALVARAATRGLDPNVPMRDSGVPWIGEVPAHWDIERGRWLFTERDERSEEGDEDMLTVSHLTGVTKRSEKDVNMFEAKSTVGYKVVHPGDLAINTLWAWMGAMGTSPHYGIVSPAYHVYEPDPRLFAPYVDALVRTERFVREVTRYSKGVWSSRLRLYPAEFFDVLFPVPPLDEQHAISHYIDRQSVALNAVARETQRSIDLLKERRGALISATVTGQRRID